MIFHNILLLMHFVWQCYDVKLSSCRRPISLFIAFIMQMLQNVMWSWLSARAGINSIHSGYSILLVSGILFRQIKTWRKTRWKELVYFLFVCELLQMALDISPALVWTDPVVHRQPETEQQKHFSTISFAVKYSRNRLESSECLNFGPNFFLCITP